jgi:hypothetical protein
MNKIKRRLVVLICLVVVMAATYMTRKPALGFTDAGFWQIFAAGMLTSAIILNLAEYLRSRRNV